MKFKYILLFIICLFTVSCFDDETTYDTHQISEITIDTTLLQRVYNIDIRQDITVSPVVSQTTENLPLNYKWWVNSKQYSDSSAFHFEGLELGTYEVHLQVSNAHGSDFYDFKLFVNSPYEEGIAVLSENKDGSTMLSFMRKYTAKELASGAIESFETNCLTVNNPGMEFASKPTDLCKRSSQLFLSCRKQPVIYALNAKTLQVENIISAPEYPDFIPVKMQIADNAFTLAAPILCENNKFYNMSTREGVILPHSVLTSTYATASHLWSSANAYLGNFWNLEQNTPCVFDSYNLLTFEESLFEGHTPIAMFNNTEGDCFTIITKHEGQYVKTTMGYYLYDVMTWPYVPDVRGEQTVISGNPELSPEMPNVASTLYKEWFYAQGNRIYRLYFSDTKFPANPWAIIDLPGAEITGLTMSPDQKQMYVSVHQPDESGLNGHVYILESDTGQQAKGSPYLHIAYKPIKLIYKIK